MRGRQKCRLHGARRSNQRSTHRCAAAFFSSRSVHTLRLRCLCRGTLSRRPAPARAARDQRSTRPVIPPKHHPPAALPRIVRPSVRWGVSRLHPRPYSRRSAHGAPRGCSARCRGVGHLHRVNPAACLLRSVSCVRVCVWWMAGRRAGVFAARGSAAWPLAGAAREWSVGRPSTRIAVQRASVLDE